ncbi:MAG TPA: hypothetical protein VEU62_05810 [Bryobacterales bacterium]|nr:hypothetical protein [Bryobacterales bacterium]
MTNCKDLTKVECAFLNELGKVFKRHRAIARRFQVAHKITHRVKALKPGENLVIMPQEVGKGHFTVAKHYKGEAVAAGADPCCVFEWDPDIGEFICVGMC